MTAHHELIYAIQAGAIVGTSGLSAGLLGRLLLRNRKKRSLTVPARGQSGDQVLADRPLR